MKVSDFLSEKNIFFVNSKDKRELFEQIAEHICQQNKDIESKEVLLRLTKKREDQSNTYATKGVAIPHIKCNNLNDFEIYLFIIKDGIDYKENEQKVRIVFMIIGPDKNYNIHLLLLSRIARLLKETPLVEKILSENKSKSIKNLINIYEEKII